MKSKLFWSSCAILCASLPLPAFADSNIRTNSNIKVDYKGSPLKYQLIPGVIPERTLPGSLPALTNVRKTTSKTGFDYPILTTIAVDNTITTNTPITDNFRPPAIPQGLSLEDVLRTRSEYTTALRGWSESIKECMSRSPRLLRVSTGNPIIINGREGTIVRNANYKAVCK